MVLMPGSYDFTSPDRWFVPNPQTFSAFAGLVLKPIVETCLFPQSPVHFCTTPPSFSEPPPSA